VIIRNSPRTHCNMPPAITANQTTFRCDTLNNKQSTTTYFLKYANVITDKANVSFNQLPSLIGAIIVQQLTIGCSKHFIFFFKYYILIHFFSHKYTVLLLPRIGDAIKQHWKTCLTAALPRHVGTMLSQNILGRLITMCNPNLQ
jgi:hypothetical protein